MPKQAIFRFYAELNDFLPLHKRQQDFTHAFELSASVKELIEADFVNLQKKLDDAGLPWTSGRAIPELKK